ncbi:MAG: hypothetical protein NC200_02415 [Candidatus Gastranaerophilales bacterium]|nr:hypothetical protein [Candidatus Gastranaerophilales bacterium]
MTIYNAITKDVLRELNQYVTDKERVFAFNNKYTSETYNLAQDTGVTASGTINVRGIQGNTDVINANGYSMFVVSNENTILNISDVAIKGAGVNASTSHSASVIDIDAKDAVVNIDRVIIGDNAQNAIYNAGTLNLTDVVFESSVSDNAISNIGTINTSGVNQFLSNITNSAIAVATPDSGVSLVPGVINFKGTEHIGGNITNSGVINVLPLDTEDLTQLVVNVNGTNYSLANGAKLFSGTINNSGSIISTATDIYTGNITNTGNIIISGDTTLLSTLSGNGNVTVVNPTDYINPAQMTVGMNGVIAEDVLLTVSEDTELVVGGGGITLDANDVIVGLISSNNAASIININGLTSNGLINATQGNLNITDGILTVYENSVLSNNVNISVETSGILALENHSGTNAVTLSTGDNWNDGYITLANSELIINAGMNDAVSFALDMDDKLVGDETSSFVNNSHNITISADETGFKGVYNQNAGSLTVTETGKMFTGTSIINNGSVSITRGNDGIDYAGIVMQSGTEFTNLANSANGGVINNDVVTLGTNAGNVTLTFGNSNTYNASVDKVSYTLAERIESGALGNSINFINSDVKYAQADSANNTYDFSGRTTYNFNNSIVNLSDSYVNNYIFGNVLTDANSGYVLDVDLLDFTSDTMTFTNSMVDRTKEQIVYIKDINIINNPNANPLDITIVNDDMKIQILKNDYVGSASNYRELNIDAISELEFVYNITSDAIYNQFTGSKSLSLGTTQTQNDSLVLTVTKRYDTLSKLNQTVFAGNATNLRNFNFTGEASDAAQTYTLIGNTGSTASGILNINGIVRDAGYDVLDADNKYSMFEVMNPNTALNINDVQIQNAVVTGNQTASVLDISAGDAVVTLDNVVLKDNSGTAVYNAGTLNLNNVQVLAAANAADNIIRNVAEVFATGTNTFGTNIYNEGNITINGDNTFNANIYNSGDMNLNDTVLITSNIYNATDVRLGTLNIYGNVTLRGTADKQVSVQDMQSVNVFNGSNLVLDNAVLNIAQGDSIAAGSYIELNDSTFTYSNITSNGVVLNAKTGNFAINSGSLSLADETVLANEMVMNLNGGTLALSAPISLTLAANDTFAQSAVVNLADRNSNLILTTGLNTDSTMNLSGSNIVGVGILTNTGVNLTVSSDESIFTGLYLQDSVQSVLNVTTNVIGGIETVKLFGGEKRITGGSVRIERTKGIDYNNFKLGTNTSLYNYSTDVTGGNIDNNVVSFTGSGATATFGKSQNAVTPERIDYNLVEDIYNNTLANTVKFENANVTLLSKEYNKGNTAYVFENSTIALIDSSIDNYVFTTLRSQNNSADVTLDINFHTLQEDGTYAITSDILTVGAASAGTITISKFNVLGIDQNDLGTVQILYTPNSNTKLAIGDNLNYEFGVVGNSLNRKEHVVSNPDGTDSVQLSTFDYVGLKAIRLATISTQDDGIEIYNAGIIDTLKAVNQYDNTVDGYATRVFAFNTNPVTGNLDELYSVRENLGVTAKGKFYVQGRLNADGTYNDVISGLGYDIVDGQIKNAADDVKVRHSLFELANAGTELYLENLTIKDAVVNNNAGNASVIDITSSNASASLTNIILEANAGNAIYNMGTLNFNNVIVGAANGVDTNAIVNEGKFNTNGINEFNSALTNNGTMTIDGTDSFNAAVSGNGNMIVNGTANINIDVTLDNDMNITLSENSTVNINSGNLYLNNGDKWSGAINLNSGNLTYADLLSNGTIVAVTGDLNILSGTLTSSADSAKLADDKPIADVVNVFVEDAATLRLQGYTVPDELVFGIPQEVKHLNTLVLSTGDTWNGNIVLETAKLVLQSGMAFNGYDAGTDVYTFNDKTQLVADRNSVLQNEGLKLTLNDDFVDTFVGTYEQNGTGAVLSVTKDGIMFSGTKNINAGSVVVTTADDGINYDSVNLGNNTTLTNYATTKKGGVVSTNTIQFVGDNASALFTNDASYVLPSFDPNDPNQYNPDTDNIIALNGFINYDLDIIVSQGIGNSVKFANSNVTLTGQADGYLDDKNNVGTIHYDNGVRYEFDNVYLNTADGMANRYYFSELRFGDSSLDSTLNIVMDICADSETMDSVYIDDTSAIGKLVIAEINLVRTTNNEDAAFAPFEYQVINGNNNLTLDLAEVIGRPGGILAKSVAQFDEVGQTYIDIDWNAYIGKVAIELVYFTGEYDEQGKEIVNKGLNAGDLANGLSVKQMFTKDLLRDLATYISEKTPPASEDKVRNFNFTKADTLQKYTLLDNTSGYLRNEFGDIVDKDGNVITQSAADVQYQGMSAGAMNINGLNADNNVLNAYGQILCYNENVWMDGERVSSASLSNDKYHHSMFVLDKKTDLGIYGVTIQNAYRGDDTRYDINYIDNEDLPQTKKQYLIYEDYAVTHGNGSVIYQINPDSNIYIQDAKIVHNRSFGLGGAIYAVKGFTINALNGDVLFDDNYQNETNTDNAFSDYNKLAPSRDAVANDIYINNTSDITMNLNAANGKTLQIKDGILWANNNYALNIDINADYGDTTGRVLLGGDFGNGSNAASNVDYKYNINVYGGGFGFVDDTVRAMNINTLTLYDDVEYYVDVNLSPNAQMTSDTIYAKNLNFGTYKLVMNSNSFNNIGRFSSTATPTYCAVALRILDVAKPAADYIKLVDENGDAVDTISWLDGRTTYYARLGINGTVIYGTSMDDRTSLLYQAVANTKSNTFKMTCSYMLYGLQGTDADGNIVDIPDFLTLQNPKLTIDGKGYSITTNNELLGFVVPEPAPKKSITLTIKNVSEIKGFNGALVNEGGKITVSGTNFNKNESDTYGSVARNEKGTLSISGSSKTHSLVKNNISNEKAGAIYNAGTFTAKYVDFGAAGTSRETFSNISEIGGALYTSGELAKSTLTSTKFIENIAGLYGGAVYSDNTLSISSSQFERNTAMSGGAVYFDTLAGLTAVPKFTISKSTFEGNNADENAGAVYTEVYLTDSSSTFKNNSAVNGNGGAVNINTLADATKKLTNKFTSTKFYGNTAGDKGGAVYINTKDYAGAGENTRTKVTFNKAVFGSTDINNKGNNAKDGGAIYNVSGDITLSTVNLIGNSASNSGGALYNESNGIVTLTKGSFGTSDKTGSVTNGNDAVYGGAIYNEGVITSKSTTFAGNKAVLGGAIYSKSSDDENVASNVTLTSVTMKYNGVTSKAGVDESPAGGAIYNAAYMNLASSTFTSNYAKDGMGGAIYNSKDSSGLDLKKVTFTGNYAQYGNAIYNDGIIGSISATFKSNITTTPGSAGGAIYNNASITSIESSTFTNNQSTNGGAIYNAVDAKIDRMYKVTAGNAKNNKYQNIAAKGGAIYNAGTITEIASSTLSRNNATTSGGAIYNTGLIASIIGTAMSYETSTSDGGAIYNMGRIESIDRTSALSSNKTTSGNGGAIYNNGSQNVEAYMMISGMTLASNTAVNGNGGAIYNGVYGTMEFVAALVGTKAYYTTFKSNSAGYNGGAIYNAGNMIFDSVTFTSNKSTSGNGGAIYNAGILNITQTSTFTSNTAYDGGAIYNAESGELTLDNVTFGNAKNNKVANKATHNGGAIYNAGKLRLSNSILSRNSSANHGGLIYAQVGSETVLATQTISYNTATGDGGAVYTLGNLYLNKDGKEELSYTKNLIFSNNSAARGGAIYAGESSVLDIIYTEFSSNKAINGNGGAIALIGGPAAVGGNMISESLFSNNTAMLGKGYTTAEDTSKGGAIYNEDDLTIEYTEFINNFAGYGGNIYNSGILTLGEGVVFRFAPVGKTKYTYTLQGGAIYNAGTLYENGDITFSSHKVNGDGGAVYNNSEGTIIFDRNASIVFENNTATGNGGALFNGNIVTMDSAEFNNNSAINGGAIYNDGVLNINNSVLFDGNSATKNGGIIFNGGELYVHGNRNNKIELSNSSAQNGGAIASGYSLYNSSSRTKLLVENVIFAENTAKVSDKDTGSKGGAIYNGGNAQPRFTTIANSEFYNNQSIGTGKSNSTGGGGAIWNDSGAAIQEDNGEAGLTYSIFEGNSTIINGGAIGNQGTIIMSHNTFNNNNATGFGGAIYNTGSYTSSDDEFTANSAGNGGAIYNGSNGTYVSSGNTYNVNAANGTGAGNGNGGIP